MKLLIEIEDWQILPIILIAIAGTFFVMAIIKGYREH